MKLIAVAKRLKVEFDPVELKLMGKCYQSMCLSPDVLHDNGHIDRMFDDLEKLIKTIDVKDINFKVLFLAICWHDTWLSLNNHEGILGTLYEYLYEGIGSAKMFSKAALEAGLDSQTIEEVTYAIRNHPGLPTSRHKTIESKILWDLDNLETWNSERLGKVVEGMGKEIDKKERRMIKMASLYFVILMKRRKAKKLYFEWSQQEFRKRREVLIEKVDELEKEFLLLKAY